MSVSRRFLVGESYAGHYIPALGKYLFEHPIEGTNFAGAAIGDGLTFPGKYTVVCGVEKIHF